MSVPAGATTDSLDLPPGVPMTAGDPRASGDRWLRLSVAAIVAAITFIAFLPALAGEFVNWDDLANFVDTTGYRGFGRDQLAWMFTTSFGGHYHPITWLSVAADYSIWGLRPAGFHLTNNMLHAFSAGLFCLVAWQLLAWGRPTGESAAAGAAGAAAFAGLAYGVHPLRVESVAWLTERRDVLSAALLMLTILAWLASVRAAGRRRLLCLALMSILFMLACLSKVSVVMLPLGLLVLDWYPLRRLGRASAPVAGVDHSAAGLAASGRWLRGPRAGVWLEKVPLLLIALVFGILSLSLQRGSRWFYGLDVHPLPARAAQCLYGIVFYVWKTLLPTGLCPLHELPIPLNPVQARFAWCAMLILCAAAALVVWRRRAGARALTAALLWYLVFIIPVLGLLQNGPQIVADRFSLLATLGFPIVAAAGLHALCGRVSHALARVLLVTSATGVIALLAALTWRQCAVWRDDLSLWSAVVARAPESAMGHAGLGLAQVEHGLYADGIAHYRMAIALQPRLGMAHERLWTAIQRQGAPPRELLEALQHSRRVYPEFVPAMLRLGDAHLQRGEADEALMEFRAAVAAAPDHAPAHAALALAHLRRGELDAAIAASAAALDRDPVCLPAMLARAEVHRLRGETDDALRLLRRAVETAPGDAESRRRLDALEHVRPRD